MPQLLAPLLLPLALAPTPAGHAPVLPGAMPPAAVAAATDTSMTFHAVARRMASMPLHRVEGIWQFPGDGGMIAIERRGRPAAGEGTEYVMRVVSSSNRLLTPGTEIGTIAPTALRDTFLARLYTATDADGVRLASPQTFSLRITDADSRLQLLHHRKQLKLNWWTMLPFMFRRLVRTIDETPRDLDGCVRVYPPPALPAEPRYL